jgi:hypothetical protein
LLYIPNHPVLQTQGWFVETNTEFMSHLEQVSPIEINPLLQAQILPFQDELMGQLQRGPLATNPGLQAQAVPFQFEFNWQGWQNPLMTYWPK